MIAARQGQTIMSASQTAEKRKRADDCGGSSSSSNNTLGSSTSDDDDDSLATMERKKRVVLAGSMVARDYLRPNSGRDKDNDGSSRLPQQTTRHSMLQPYRQSVGSRPGSSVAGRGWSSSGPAHRRGSEDLEKGTATVAAGPSREQ